MTPAYLERLGLDQEADERAIRRAYARELKQIDQEAEPAAFQSLREAYEAALGWAQWRKEEAQDNITAAQQEAVPGAAAEAMPSAEAQAPEPPPYADQANAAFAAFLQHIAAPEAARATSTFWLAQLERSLDELFSIDARELFEYHIATLLTQGRGPGPGPGQGWQPGHEMLLVAATATFHWKEDRRRLYRLGMAGALLDRALEEHAMFSLQKETARAQQSKLITRLRDPRPPSTGELIGTQATLAWLQANYSAWLSIITNLEAIPRWRQAYDAVPGWRRKLSPAGWGKQGSDTWELQTSFSWKWLWLLLIVGLVRMCTNFSSDKPKPPPAPPQQTAAQPRMSGDYLAQGDAYLNNQKFDDAIDSYNRVLDRNANNYMAWIGRGLAYLGLDDDLQAEQDFNQAATLDNDNHALYTARGKLAMFRQQPAQAVASYSKAIALLTNGDLHLLSLRADAYDHLDDSKHALEDVNAMIKAQPDLPWRVYTERLRLMQQQGQMAAMARQAEATLSRFHTEPAVYSTIAELYRSQMLDRQARAVIERAIKALPKEASFLLMRAALRPAGDLAGRRADLVRASAMDAQSIEAVQQQVDLELGAGNPPAAASVVASAIQRWSKQDANWPGLLALRGVVTARQGRQSAAEQDFSDALKAASKPWQMNNICWIMAVRNVSLPTALFICNAALEISPNHTAALDSRGLVLLRMGRNQDALASYEAALRNRNHYYHSLLGRGLARQRLGDQAGGEADVRTALRRQPLLRRDYLAYGFKV